MGRPENLPALAAVLALHGVALVGLFAALDFRILPQRDVPLLITLMPEMSPPPPVEVPPPPKSLPPPLRIETSRQVASLPAPVTVAPPPEEPAAPPPAPPQPAPPRPAPPAPVTPPVFDAAYLNNPAPAYPMESRRAREEGEVVLMVMVSEQGRATSVSVHQSSGHVRLDRAAVAAVRRWRFVPAQQNGQPRAARVLVPLGFFLS